MKWESGEQKHKLLMKEVNICRSLHGGKGIPSVKWFGEVDSGTVMVMEFLGPLLQKRLELSGRFAFSNIMLIGEQLVERVEYIHGKG